MKVGSDALVQNLRGRHELRWIAAAVVALAIGAIGANLCPDPDPYYRGAAEILAMGHPWQVMAVELQSPEHGSGAVVRLTGLVKERPEDLRPSGRVRSKLQVAAVVESPIIFWTLLLVWPAQSHRQRLRRAALGLAAFLGLEAATTVCQLLDPLANMSAMLAGDRKPLTSWEMWSRFLEAGGRIVVAITAALLIIAATSRHSPTRAR